MIDDCEWYCNCIVNIQHGLDLSEKALKDWKYSPACGLLAHN